MNSENSLTNKIMVMLLSQFQKDKEFFLTKLNRDNFREATLDLLGINDKKGKNLYSIVYRKFLKRKKLDKYKYSNPRFRRNISNSEFKNVKITAKPSGITEQPKTQVEIIKENFEKDFKDDKETEQLKTQTKEDGESRLVVYDHWTARSIGSVFDGLLAPLRALWPEMKGLSDEEKESIGQMLLPGFQRYGNETFQYFIFPLMGTAGILGPKIVKGRKLHKESQEKKRQKKLDIKLTKDDRANKLTCTFCNEMFDSAYIKDHQETCKKRINTQ